MLLQTAATHVGASCCSRQQSCWTDGALITHVWHIVVWHEEDAFQMHGYFQKYSFLQGLRLLM
jgi:hypothetical protein